MENNKPYSKMTKSELMDMIRKSTLEVNERLQEYRESGEEFKDVESAIKIIKNLSGVERGRVMEIGVGRLSAKNKPALIRQARELNSFLQWDISTPEGKCRLEAREKAEWNTFHENYPDWRYEEWRDMVESFGAVGKAIVDEYDSDSVRALVKEFSGKGKRIKNLADLMQKIHLRAKNDDTQVWTPEKMVDALRYEIIKNLVD